MIKRANVWQNLPVSTIPFISRSFQDFWSRLLSLFLCLPLVGEATGTADGRSLQVTVQRGTCLSIADDVKTEHTKTDIRYQRGSEIKLLAMNQ